MTQQPIRPEDSFSFTALILFFWATLYAVLDLVRANWLAGLAFLSVAALAGAYLLFKRSERHRLWVLLKNWLRYLWVSS